MHDSSRASFFVLTATALAISGTVHGQCLDWKAGFDAKGIPGTVLALASYDDGTGPALYAGGWFESAGGAHASGLARWNGSTWSAVPPNSAGVPGGVSTLAAVDDGSGMKLYVDGGFFSLEHIASWDGTHWASLGTGLDSDARALIGFDDGSGPALYAAGWFTTAGGSPANRIAKWQGGAWSAVGAPGLDDFVQTLAVFDDGSGPALYAGGHFTTAGGVGANHVARWDGSSWSPLGTGTDSDVDSLVVFDDGSGPALYAGGGFAVAGGAAVHGVARWNGSAWSDVGGGLASTSAFMSMVVHDDGTGPALFVSALHDHTPQTVERWDGNSWSTIGVDISARTLAVYGSGPGAILVAGGSISHDAQGNRLDGIAVWNGTAWTAEAGAHASVNGDVHALAGFDDGSGNALYVGGSFDTAGSTDAAHVASWNGSTWAPLGLGTDGDVNALAVFDDGSGPALHAGGSFTTAGGAGANRIAKWQGGAWIPVGAPGLGDTVRALAVFDDGSGNALYAGGDFIAAGGASANHVARWDGSVWSPLGPGLNGSVFCFAVFDDGSGPALYAGGEFYIFGGGTDLNFIARWNGSAWSGLATGLDTSVYALAVFDAGSGPSLYAGGAFAHAIGGPYLLHVARWNGSSWSALGSGLVHVVRALAVFDDGAETALYAGGNSGSLPNLGRWNGTAWSTFGSHPTDSVLALATYDLDASGSPDLFAGGSFRQMDDVVSWHVAQFQGCEHTGTRFCAGDGTGAACPCGNSGAHGHGCQNAFGTGGGVMEASGTPSLAADSLHVTASDLHTNALCVLMQGNVQVGPVIYGDGLRCVGGQLTRLFVRAAVGEVLAAPLVGEPSISTQSTLRGDSIAAGTMRVYQVFYRDPAPNFCPNPPGGTFNVSSAVRIDWLP